MNIIPITLFGFTQLLTPYKNLIECSNIFFFSNNFLEVNTNFWPLMSNHSRTGELIECCSLPVTATHCQLYSTHKHCVSMEKGVVHCVLVKT